MRHPRVALRMTLSPQHSHGGHRARVRCMGVPESQDELTLKSRSDLGVV